MRHSSIAVVLLENFQNEKIDNSFKFNCQTDFNNNLALFLLYILLEK